MLPPLGGDDNSSFDDIDALPPFVYKPLSSHQREIRILYLYGSRNSDGIPTALLNHESLDARPPYIALSYV